MNGVLRKNWVKTGGLLVVAAPRVAAAAEAGQLKTLQKAGSHIKQRYLHTSRVRFSSSTLRTSIQGHLTPTPARHRFIVASKMSEITHPTIKGRSPKSVCSVRGRQCPCSRAPASAFAWTGRRTSRARGRSARCFTQRNGPPLGSFGGLGWAPAPRKWLDLTRLTAGRWLVQRDL